MASAPLRPTKSISTRSCERDRRRETLGYRALALEALVWPAPKPRARMIALKQHSDGPLRGTGHNVESRQSPSSQFEIWCVIPNKTTTSYVIRSSKPPSAAVTSSLRHHAASDSSARFAIASLMIFSTATRRAPLKGARGARTCSVDPIVRASASLIFCTR